MRSRFYTEQHSASKKYKESECFDQEPEPSLRDQDETDGDQIGETSTVELAFGDEPPTVHNAQVGRKVGRTPSNTIREIYHRLTSSIDSAETIHSPASDASIQDSEKAALISPSDLPEFLSFMGTSPWSPLFRKSSNTSDGSVSRHTTLVDQGLGYAPSKEIEFDSNTAPQVEDVDNQTPTPKQISTEVRKNVHAYTWSPKSRLRSSSSSLSALKPSPLALKPKSARSSAPLGSLFSPDRTCLYCSGDIAVLRGTEVHDPKTCKNLFAPYASDIENTLNSLQTNDEFFDALSQQIIAASSPSTIPVDHTSNSGSMSEGANGLIEQSLDGIRSSSPLSPNEVMSAIRSPRKRPSKYSVFPPAAKGYADSPRSKSSGSRFVRSMSSFLRIPHSNKAGELPKTCPHGKAVMSPIVFTGQKGRTNTVGLFDDDLWTDGAADCMRCRINRLIDHWKSAIMKHRAHRQTGYQESHPPYQNRTSRRFKSLRLDSLRNLHAQRAHNAEATAEANPQLLAPAKINSSQSSSPTTGLRGKQHCIHRKCAPGDDTENARLMTRMTEFDLKPSCWRCLLRARCRRAVRWLSQYCLCQDQGESIEHADLERGMQSSKTFESGAASSERIRCGRAVDGHVPVRVRSQES